MERQLRLHQADLLAVAVGCDRHGAIRVPELRRFEKCQRRNTFARSKFKGTGNEGIIFISADFL